MAVTAGCAAPGLSRQGPSAERQVQPPARTETTMILWRLGDLARHDTDAILLRSSQGLHGAIKTATARRILGVGNRLLGDAAPGAGPELSIMASEAVNAFAFYDGNRATVAISQGMVRLLGEDDDAWAALIGHELAHLRLDHHKRQLERRQRTDATSSVAGAVLSALGLPFASIAADATAMLASRAYSRDDEREADRTGLKYMQAAGFDADGAIRLQQYLLAAGGNTGIQFLNTHPGGQERIDDLKHLIAGGK